MPQAVEDYLRSLNTSDRARAAAWDAVYKSADDADFEQRLKQLPFSDDVRADLWDLRQGGELSGPAITPQPANPAQFTEAPPQPEGSATGRFVRNMAAQLNPIEAVKGVVQAVTSPLVTAQNLYTAHADQFGKAGEAWRQGRLSEAAGHAAAGVIPLVGPAAANAGEQIGSGDIAGGAGSMAGLLLPAGAPALARSAVRGARRVMSPAGRESMAAGLEAGARGRVAEVMSPQVGREKVRRGNQAERVAPRIVQDMAEQGAPWSREGLAGNVTTRYQAARKALDEATDARLSARTFETQPILDSLREARAKLTAEAVEGSRPIRAAGPNGQLSSVPLGEDVVPGPNAARVAVIDQAIAEIQQLGPVARYEPIRRIRQAYDSQAEVRYSPSVTVDFLKNQQGAQGAADVTYALRQQLATWDPQTAAANADFSLYKTANDVLEATREVERTRPRVGRLIANRIFGVVAGGNSGGVLGAATGYVAAPLLDAGSSLGMTTKLRTAALQQRLATAIRTGNVQQVTSLADQLKRLTPQAAVLTEQARATAGATAQGSPAGTPPPSAQR